MSESDSPLRQRLPPRRDGRTVKLDYTTPASNDTQHIYVTAGYDPGPYAAPRVLECFLRPRRGQTGSMLNWLLDDLGAMISDALQHARTPRGLRDFLGAPDLDGKPVSLIAAIVDTLIEIQDELVTEWQARRTGGAS